MVEYILWAFPYKDASTFQFSFSKRPKYKKGTILSDKWVGEITYWIRGHNRN